MKEALPWLWRMLYTEGRGAFWNSVRKACNKWLDKIAVLTRKKRDIDSK